MPPKSARKKEESGGGGHIQRDEAESAAASSDHLHSELARFLLVSYLSGKTSLPFIVAIACLVMKEPFGGHSDTQTIPSLGGGGARPNDMKKDLFRLMKVFAIESAIYTVRLPIRMYGALDWIDFDMLYPYSIFAKLYESDPVEFGRRFYGGRRGKIR